MKVRISYTVDIEEVPLKLQQLLEESEEILFNIKKLELKQITENNMLEVLNYIEATRKDLIKADSKMADCQSMLSGYAKTILSKKLEKENNEQGEDSNGYQSE